MCSGSSWQSATLVWGWAAPQWCSAALGKQDTDCLLDHCGLAFTQQNPSSLIACVVLFSFFSLHLAPLWLEKPVLRSLLLFYWCHSAFNMPFNMGRILLAKRCYVLLHPVQVWKWWLFLNRCTVNSAWNAWFGSQHCNPFITSSAQSFSHSTYTPRSHILSNALTFTYMILLKSVTELIGIGYWNALFSGNHWFK